MKHVYLIDVFQLTNIIHEDNKDYCHAWEERTALTSELASCQRTEYQYTAASDLKGLPYTAAVDMYTGGGYVYRLNKPAKQVEKDLIELRQQHWLNNHTRAVFLEFSTYNSNVSQ